MARQRHPVWGEERGTNLTFAILRIAVSAVLIWGALTKLVDGDRIEALAEVWAAAGLPEPQFWLTASITLQLLLAVLLLVGLFARLAGLVNGVNFAVAAAISGIFTSGSNWWPFALLVLLLLHYGITGAGKLSVDGYRSRRAAAGSLEDLLASMGVKPNSGDGNHPG
jgi:uncharacterized membrane protein YphA (DoxX/SURF4 family)